MASPYNTTDEMNSQTATASAATKGTQISRPAQTSRVFDANDSKMNGQMNGQMDGQTDSQTDGRTEQSMKQPIKQSMKQNVAKGEGSGVDVLRGSLTNAFDQIVKEIEPQISEFASNFAHQAMDKGADYGRQAVQRVQKQSWGRIGLAAALIVGAVAVLGYTAAEAVDQDSLH